MHSPTVRQTSINNIHVYYANDLEVGSKDLNTMIRDKSW